MHFCIGSDFGVTGADVRVGNCKYLLNQQTLCNDVNVYLTNQYYEISLINSAIMLVECDVENEIHFKVATDAFYEEIKFTIDNNGYYFTHYSGDVLNMHIKKKEYSLIDFFKDNPPRVKFVDQSTLEGNYYVTLLEKSPLKFPSSNIIKWNWKEKGVNITVESQGLNKKKDSIQYCVINHLKSLHHFTSFLIKKVSYRTF